MSIQPPITRNLTANREPFRPSQRVILLPHPKLSAAMSDLIHRLKQIQKPVPVELPDISHYKLEDLMDMKITFGSTHVGKSFEHMWNHEQSWITWFTPRYVKSSKLEHRLVTRFVEMKVALHESQGTTMPVLPSLKDTMTLMPKTSENDLPGGYPKAKAKTSMAKASTNTVPPGRPSMTEHAEEFEFLMDEWSLQRDDWPDQAEPSVNQADVQALQSRMLNLENALQQVITHLQGLTPSSKTEEA